MPAKKEGTTEEKAKIIQLLKDDSFKMVQVYRPVWSRMCNSAAKDAAYHSNLTSKKLAKSNIAGLMDLTIPDYTLPSFRLSIPSLAFVYMKIYKTFDIKLAKIGRGNINLSHAQDWAVAVDKCNDYIATNRRNVKLNVFDSERMYAPLPDDVVDKIRQHRTEGDVELGMFCSDGDDAGPETNVLDVPDDSIEDDPQNAVL